MKYPPQAVICASSTGGHRRFVPAPGDFAPWIHPGDARRKDEQTNCAWNLKCAGRVSGQMKNREISRKSNSFGFRLTLRLFAVRFAHSLASEAGLPGNGFCIIVAAAGKCLFYKTSSIRSRWGPGCDAHPGGSARAAPSPCSLLLHHPLQQCLAHEEGQLRAESYPACLPAPSSPAFSG